MKNIACILIFSLLALGQVAAQCIVADVCPASPVEKCDLTPNDQFLWNEAYWLDPVTSLHDMPDAPVDLSFTATDTCANGSIGIKYILFLDLDGNGVAETLVDSDDLPGFNVVQFGNALGAGTPRAFDERSEAANQKFGFALETVTNDPTTTARVRWNTAAQPGVFSNPQLPYGLHKIKWFVTDGQGNESVCDYNFLVKDCKQPVVVCLNGLSVNIMPTGLIQLWATDFLQYMEDNHTPILQLDIAVRKAGTGSGFPVDTAGNPIQSVVYDCSELGDQIIELWARDEFGNADFCNTFVFVLDNMGVCSGTTDADVVVCARHWSDNAVVAGVEYNLGPADSFDPATGCARFEDVTFSNGNFAILPHKDDDHLNGVNALDLIRIARHILGIQPLGSPYAMFAADANKSGSVTTFDIVEHKKLIQGIYGELPNNDSWRFVDANFVFPDPVNPFASWPDTLSYTVEDSVVYFDFVAIKVGDTDGNAHPGFGNPTADDRSTATLTLPDATLQPGETLDIPLRFADAGEWLGLQLGLRFDPDLLEIESAAPGNLPGMDAASFASPRPGSLNVVWFDAQPHLILPDENLLTLRVRALAPLRLREAISLSKKQIRAEAYTAGEATQALQLAFVERSATASETFVIAPQPNPTHSGATVKIQLAQAENVLLEVADVSGKMLFSSKTNLSAGVHLLEIPASTLPQTGVYFWRAQAGETASSGRLLKM